MFPLEPPFQLVTSQIAQIAESPEATPEERRDQLDLIIVVVYLISVVYVLYQAYFSIQERTVFDYDKEFYKQQLKKKVFGETQLEDIVDIDFKFEKYYLLTEDGQPKDLGITIKNKSKGVADDPDNPIDHVSILVDWDSSSVTDYEERSRRVIRLTPDKRMEDLSQTQVFSMVPPGKTQKEKITAEDVLGFDKDKDTLEPKKPIIDIEQLKKSADNPKTPKKVKDMYADFANEKKPLQFSLRLWIGLVTIANGERKEYWQSLRFNFTVAKLPRKNQFPWNPNKK